jgi:hypothetical protein
MRSGVRLVPLKSRCSCGGAGIRLNLKAGGESYYFGVDGRGGPERARGRVWSWLWLLVVGAAGQIGVISLLAASGMS